MKYLKHIISGLIWTIVCLYFTLVILLHIPAIQGFIGTEVASALSKKLGTKVSVGRVDIGFMNRFIVDDVTIMDQKNKKMLSSTRLSVKFDYLPLASGKISISSAQIFGAKAVLYKETASAKPNFQFVLDSLASKDTTKHTPLDLQINSLIIRHGSVKYDRLDVYPQKNIFCADHLNVTDISAHIIVNAAKDDSLNVTVKKLALNEASGLKLKSLTFRCVANKKAASLKDFSISFPKTNLLIPNASATYSFSGKKFNMPSLQFNATLNKSSVTPSDFSWIVPQLEKFVNPISISTDVSGTSTSLTVNDINIASTNNSIRLFANGAVSNWTASPKWFANIKKLELSDKGIKFMADNLGSSVKIPEVITRLGNLFYKGRVGGNGDNLSAKGMLHTDAGNTNISFGKTGKHFTSHIETEGLNLKKILANDNFGEIATDIDIDGIIPSPKVSFIKAKGIVSKFDYNSYRYSNLLFNGTFNNGTFDGVFGMDDPNGKVNIKGKINLSAKEPSTNIVAQVQHLNLSALKIADLWNGANLNFNIAANFKGKTLNTANGSVNITDFSLHSAQKHYKLSTLNIIADGSGFARELSLNSDFGNINIQGNYDYATIIQSFTNYVGSRLPTLPGLPKTNNINKNNFTINANIYDSEWLTQLFNIPLALYAPLTINGAMNDKARRLEMTLDMPDFIYSGSRYKDGRISITTPNDTLKANVAVKKLSTNGQRMDLAVKANAINNTLNTSIAFNNHSKNPLKGVLNADAQFFKTNKGVSAARINVLPSDIFIGNSIWNLHPSEITYSKDNLAVKDFKIENDKQHIIISGMATKSANDTLFVDTKDVDVSYILNLVNFHSVDFSGLATCRANITSVFSKPQASAAVTVNDFKFEDGRMGVLSANVNYDNKEEEIVINAIANDGPLSRTVIKGYVSPQRNYIDLGIKATNTNIEFIEGFCGSFMSDVNANGNGEVRLYGPLNKINLVGRLNANGSLHIKSLNTDYTLRDDIIDLGIDEIQFKNDTIFDKYGKKGVVTGSLYHSNLKNLSYDINVKAMNLLSYDFNKPNDGDDFYGTVFATGDCNIKGKPGEVTIDVNAKPEKGSIIVYNIANPDAISNNEFIHWNDPTAQAKDVNDAEPSIQDIDIPTDIHINFSINCDPNATLKLMMDNQTGDYITLNGNGMIRATYYNKGSFDIFGNYIVDHGVYKLTIQNVIKREFQFTEGGTISFGGDPFGANLNLKAQYAVNGVSLSDLNIGKSFTSNNIRVNCLMNIGGTAGAPKVDFNMDMPTVGTDAKQMIYSLINSEEEMNQQVLFLLAIGRFYNQNGNNASADDASTQQSQTSLAMQSILSGTISQQISNVLSSVVNNTNWNFGANISTGNEGWNDAEYEGLLSGRLLNNRLLINGQFGYRDNPNATSSFIGDFDIRYLLLPSGNIAINVYNQTNDRYFTRNSLNTQGLGLILKKDFNGWKELFGIKKKSTTILKKKASNKQK